MIPVVREDLESIKQGLERIVSLAHADIKPDRSPGQRVASHVIGEAAATMKRMIDHYLRTTV